MAPTASKQINSRERLKGWERFWDFWGHIAAGVRLICGSYIWMVHGSVFDMLLIFITDTFIACFFLVHCCWNSSYVLASIPVFFMRLSVGDLLLERKATLFGLFHKNINSWRFFY